MIKKIFRGDLGCTLVEVFGMRPNGEKLIEYSLHAYSEEIWKRAELNLLINEGNCIL